MTARGEDPSHERAKARAKSELMSNNTFGVVALEWQVKRRKSWSPRTAQSMLHRLHKYLFPVLENRPLQEITAPEVLAVLRTIEERGATHLTSKIKQMAGQVFRDGIACGRCSVDPTYGLQGALETHVGSHQPAVKQAEFPSLMKAIAGYGSHQAGDECTRLALQLLALTFVRTSELIQATWDEFDLDLAIWKIAASRMKMKREHWVPLSEPAIAILRRLRVLAGDSGYILPGRNARGPMSYNTMLFALYRMGYRSRMTGHGFRSAASTILNENGFRPDLIEKQLAHEEPNAIRAAYNHAEYIKERTEMMVWWGRYLEPMLRPAGDP